MTPRIADRPPSSARKSMPFALSFGNDPVELERGSVFKVPLHILINPCSIRYWMFVVTIPLDCAIELAMSSILFALGYT
nr:MAG TPA: hypothetical protein [Caudoviricetes sp.]